MSEQTKRQIIEQTRSKINYFRFKILLNRINSFYNIVAYCKDWYKKRSTKAM